MPASTSFTNITWLFSSIGMMRIGIRPDEEGMKLVKAALDMPGIEVEGIFTHFAKSDEKDKSSAGNQLALFKDFVEKIQ